MLKILVKRAVANVGEPMRGRTATPATRQGLVGREHLIAEILELLSSGTVRCLALVGPSGVGKTVAAIEAIRRFVLQAPVPTDRFPLSARPGSGEIEALARCLEGLSGPDAPGATPPPPGRKRLVLVDGAESLSSATVAISTALDRDPDLTVLTTSMRRPGLAGVRILPIGPLAVPDEGCRMPSRALEAPAVQLLCDAILAVDPAFRLTRADVAAVVALSRELDGHPLALELAGARCGSLSIPRVLDLWRSAGPRALRSTTSAGPVHHRALSAALQLNWQDLPGDARRVLGFLAVHSGPFRWESALAVLPTTGPWSASRREIELADVLEVLLQRGLARRLPTQAEGASQHFFIPEPIRRFALAGSVELDVKEARRRHAGFYRDVAHDVAASWWTLGPERRSNLAADRQNLVSALEYTFECESIERALSFAIDLEPLWMTLGGTPGVTWIELLLATFRAERGARRSRADDGLEALALVTLVALHIWSPSPIAVVEARQLVSEAVALARAAGRPDVAIRAEQAEIQALLLHGDNDAAGRLAEKGVTEARSARDSFAEVSFRRWAAVAENNAGHSAAALEHAIVARDLAREAGDEYHVLMASHVMTGIAGAASDPRADLPNTEDLLAVARRLGEDRVEGMVLFTAAVKCNLLGQPDAAARFLLDTLELARRIGAWQLEEVALITLVTTAGLADEDGPAAELHGSLQRVIATMRRHVPPPMMRAYDHSVTTVHKKLGDEAFRRHCGRGRRLDWTAAIVRAEEIAVGICAKAESSETLPPISRLQGSDRSGLSARERQILELLSSGASNKEIATKLGLRPKTVMHYTSALYRKLGVGNRAEAVGAAWTRGFLLPAEESGTILEETR